MAEDEREPWYVERSLGRFDVVHWRGLVAWLVLIVVLVTGMGVESALRVAHPVLALLVEAPLGLLAIGLTLVIVERTQRRD